METKTFVSEAGHWYDKEGNPCYTIIGKNGKERNTTLRDARKNGYLPSVTQIIKEAAKPGLENWKQDQILLAALTLPKIEGETEELYISRIKEDAKQQAIKAAAKGTELHKWLQLAFEGQTIPVEFVPYYQAAKSTIEEKFSGHTWICEKSFATERYGGKVDLHIPDGVVLDIKTKEDISNAKTWDEHDMQIAAYMQGLGLSGFGGILFVSTLKPEAKLVLIEVEQLERGQKMFNSLVNYYYSKTGL